jgi:PAS domain S-box-containing protein
MIRRFRRAIEGGSATMPSIFRISQPGREPVVDVGSVEAVEGAIRESQERLQVARSAARMGIWTWDLAADTLTRDANLNRLLGLDPVETQQHLREFLDRIHPDDRAVVTAAFDACAQRGRPLNLEFRVVRPDGAVCWLRHQGGCFGGLEGGAPHIAGTSVDITDLMETEQALRRARKVLEDRVAARTSKLALKPHSRAYTSARELCQSAVQLAQRANEAAARARTPEKIQQAARLAVSTARAAESALRLVLEFDVLKFEAIEREGIEAIWTEVRQAIVRTEEEQRRRISPSCTTNWASTAPR